MATAAPEVSSLVRDRAFEALYRRYVKDVYHYALALLRNPADAEDVTQTTFMNAYRAFKRGEPIEKPHNWLIKIAHNAARTRYARASRRVSEVPLDEHLEQLAVPEAERPDVRAVLDALGRLPLNQRAALVMRELEGRTYAEIAETLGVSVAAVETLIFRARRSLRVKASAIRVLSGVPVPGSLSQLVGAGSVAAGGGAIVGTGFVLKAAVVIVAGVVATGINSDRPSGAEAASKPAAAQAAITATKIVVKDKSLGRARADGRAARPTRHDATHSSGVAVPRRLRPDGDPTATVSAAGGTQTARPEASAAAAPTSPTTAPQTAAQPAATAVDTVTAPVQSAAGTVGSVSSALPVQSPPPVAVPSVPAPPLPTTPSLPSVP